MMGGLELVGRCYSDWDYSGNNSLTVMRNDIDVCSHVHCGWLRVEGVVQSDSDPS